ncbi:16S rRNA (cytosine(967)-C(5))-methyltransferase RsmB [Candidatus Oleimmundimicrobium sp.]|uniref:16S rRNA (cytosine(967)-C(5))-methyltransferase RsmB n=1 Tax=Candidatus Oleimmundimicrobium sp. TaxID=3060597 RepID=UPI00272415C6|nr:16S rRNA (cytosine(967)-C(5))-methyltransferase RsmB [Candidatus Oleimmundimicrobium sp.]MDO8885382.1 16S rRNA (cytosine(967)-C(5))-methyltransferase RsmB [Candidatus Oleimmundimicrobium sp.]
MIISARELALNVIYKVHTDKGFVNPLLSKAFTKSKLSRLDKALTTELVYGTLRMEGSIDWIISQFSSRKINEISPKALDILRLGVYQIFYLDKIPARAAIDESVKLAKKNFHQGIANFTNGILREIERNKDKIIYPKKEDDLVTYISIKYSHPKWLVQKWIREMGPEETEDLCKENNVRPKLKLRTNLLKNTAKKLANLLKKKGITTFPSDLLPEGLVIADGLNLDELEEFKKGLFFVQDESSMVVSHVLSPQEGETVLDICAAPGGKTTHLAEIMKNKGLIIAIDINSARLCLLEQSCKRMGCEIASIVELDALKLDKLLRKPVDKILLDAPCSGLGVLARRPDARWRKNSQQIRELAILQQKLLESAARFLKCGGRLVYSVCTISNEETLDIITNFLDTHSEFELEDINDRLPKQLKTGDKWIQFLPHKHKTDGMFIASLIRIK